MLPLYCLLAGICFLVIAFTSFDIKHLSRMDKEEDVTVKMFKSKSFKLEKLEIVSIVILFLEMINMVCLFLGFAMIGVITFEAFKNDQIMWLIILEAIYAFIIVLFAFYFPRAIARRGEAPKEVTASLVIVTLVYPTYLVVKAFKKLFKKKSKEEEKIDEEVLNEMVDSFEEEGVIEEEEAEMVRGAIDLHNLEVEQIMTPRVDIFAIDVEEDINELRKDYQFYVHSRIPVYEETIDHIIGILPVNVLNKAILRGDKDIDIKSICYEPLYIASNCSVLDLLKDFKKTKTHIAVIVDEYGGTLGIVTMEDILEEIVGDIFDEMDEIEEEIKDKGNGKYIVDGSMNIDDFFQEIGYEEEYEGDFVTVSGLCQELLGRFPKKGDEISFANYTFKVLSMYGYVIDKLEVNTLEED